MNQSKPGAKLSPIIRPITERIWRNDHDSYQRLNITLWIWRQQKAGWEDEAIAQALTMMEPMLQHITSIYRYGAKLLPKAKARATATESDNYKKSDMAIASEFVKFLETRRKSNGIT